MMQIHHKRKARPKASCIYYATGPAHDNGFGIRCRLTTYSECNPDSCPWYRSQEMADASYERARQIWARNHGRDNYYARGYGPKFRMLPQKDPDKENEA